MEPLTPKISQTQVELAQRQSKYQISLRTTMPKERPCLNEHSPCPSSKNAKDKSNNIILMAIRETKHADDSNRRGSTCSSEKDSGYSDSSDRQHTDGEDQQTNTGHFRPRQAAKPSQSGQNKEPGLKNPTMMPARVNHPPIYIMKDRALKKQPAMIQKRGQLLWTNAVRVSNQSGSPHMILFDQPRLMPATIELHEPSSRTSNMTGKKTNGNYLPILKTYPSIAPHPSKKPPDKSSSNQEYQNLSKRVCTEHKMIETPAARSVPEQHLPKQPNLTVSHYGVLCSPSTSNSLSSSTPTITSSVLGSPFMSVHTTSSFPSTNRVDKNSISTRHRRFLNTVEILKQSGLLDITLRTKELLRQSNAIEQDISQLRQHTELLCHAANNPTLSLNGTTAWEHLHQVMAESGNYPSLKIHQKLQGPSQLDFSSQQESIPIGVMNRPQAADSLQIPSSCVLASTPEQFGRIQSKKPEARVESSDKIPFTYPDSSTD